ncbi:MAG: DUF2214 family protein [Mesorhizobium sp.]
MFTDFLLASAHHVLVFALLALLTAELFLVKPGIGRDTINRVAILDGIYGGVAIAVVAVGAARVVWGLKGWDAYVGNVWFWHKIGVFVLVGLLSVLPTIRFTRWRKAVAADPSFTAPDGEVKAARRIIHAEAGLFMLIPIFAAAMARYGA